jgi:hypothetical protein
MEEVPDLDEDEQAAFWRGYQLLEAFRAPGAVEIDGVTFDFTWDLDKSVWKPVAQPGTHGPLSIRFSPRIAFPWTPPEIIELWARAGEVVEAPAGSVVKIAAVHSAPMSPTYGVLDVAEHRERKLAYLWVIRPGHDLRVAEPPLMLLAETATVAHIEVEDYSRAYNSLIARLERLIETNDLENRLDGPIKDWPKLPAHLSQTHRRAILALREGFGENDEHAYAIFGYLMGRAEAEIQLLPPALRDHAAAEGRVKGGQVKRALSRQETEPLRDAAKRVIWENPQTSLTGCARAIGALFAADPDWSMSTETNWISTCIKELFERRDIGGKFEYRPKPEWTP